MPEEVVDRWDVPGIEFADLQERSAKYLEENNVHKLDESEPQFNYIVPEEFTGSLKSELRSPHEITTPNP